MEKDEVIQKLTLLPDEVIERNIQSWKPAIWLFSEHAPHLYSSLVELIRQLEDFGQAKLFQGGTSLLTLMISTKEERGLEKRDGYITVDLEDENSAIIIYDSGIEDPQGFTCEHSEMFSVLQPLLERLWNETRGKKNA